MAKIVIDNVEFDFDIGCKLLKLKYEEPPFDEVSDFWEDIVPCDFSEIALITNMEQRRVAMNCYGLERIKEKLNPELLNTETLEKSTMWVVDGELVEHKFKDVYSLFRVPTELLLNENRGHKNVQSFLHFVECKDTSTDRTYLIWVDAWSVLRSKGDSFNLFHPSSQAEQYYKDLTAVDAIAWTIQTDVPVGQIEKIIRQGDCILVKPTDEYWEKDNTFSTFRHLTAKEYKELLIAES